MSRNLKLIENVTFAATLRVSGALEKSTEVMKSMQTLIKVPEVMATMREMSKEMMKVLLVSHCDKAFTLRFN